MKKNFLLAALLITASLFFGSCSSIFNSTGSKGLVLPGIYKNYTLLPNGWKLTPIGRHVEIGELPLNMIITSDEKYALTSNSGLGENSISVVDLKAGKEVQRKVINNTWRGLDFNSNQSKLYVSGGNNNSIYIYNFNKGKLSLADSIVLGSRYPKDNISITGLTFVKQKNYVLAVTKENNMLYVCDAASNCIIKEIPMEGKCFEVNADHKGDFAYVSVWGKSKIARVDLESFKITDLIKVGDHPCEMIISKDDSRLFVADANNNTVSVVNLRKKKMIENLNAALKPNMPYGSTPDAICFNGDESILCVANADNNYLALFDIADKRQSKSIGFIPTGWYPTSVKHLNNSDEIIVANGKGFSSLPNPYGPDPLIKNQRGEQYIGTLFKGSLSIINTPSKSEQKLLSKTVYDNTPYIYKEEVKADQSVIPAGHIGKRSEKIKHVFYIIKENRTYDQVFGDIKKGNGDSSITIFGRKITPNEHYFAENYTLFDNFYVDAEVSADGHNWSTAAYATDFVEKLWPVSYGRRGQPYAFEGGVPAAAPSSGYIWNNVMKHNLKLRNYGEFVDSQKDEFGNYVARDEDLKPYTCGTYPPFDLRISDVARYENWAKDFDKLISKNEVPDFNLLRLPNDHTSGTRKGTLTPLAYVAQNDYALGMIVDKISHSKIWKESIIFVLEDDAQDGSDHVDAHRSCLMVIGPYVKRGFVDHTMYSTSSVLKTMELILGLPPMTQYDLSATPILAPVTDDADFDPYNCIVPLIDIHQKNIAGAYGALESEQMNLTIEDATPEIEFNEIIWKSVKGRESQMPAPVRSAFVKVLNKEEDDD